MHLAEFLCDRCIEAGDCRKTGLEATNSPATDARVLKVLGVDHFDRFLPHLHYLRLCRWAELVGGADEVNKNRRRPLDNKRVGSPVVNRYLDVTPRHAPPKRDILLVETDRNAIALYRRHFKCEVRPVFRYATTDGEC